jgi:hypothetical protein
MMTSYFDETIVDTIKFTLVAGWASTLEEWQQFEYDWKIFLAKFDVPHLHMKEFGLSTGPFKKWKGKEGTRKDFIRTASNIINADIRHGFVSCVSDGVFDKIDSIYELRGIFKSPYALAGRACATLASNWRKKETSESQEMEYVFEDGGPDKGDLISAMLDVPPGLPAPIFKPGKDWKPSTKWPDGRKGLVQLQPADYLAYEIGKFAHDHGLIKAGERKFRASLGVLPEKKITRLFFTPERLAATCRILNIKRRK